MYVGINVGEFGISCLNIIELCHENLLLFLSIIENVCHGIHEYKRAYIHVACDIARNKIFVIVFKCFISSIKDYIDLTWNELYQTVTGMCHIY